MDITIEKCPVCSGKHTLNIDPPQAPRPWGAQGANRRHNDGEPQTVILMCPVKEEEFEADVTF